MEIAFLDSSVWVAYFSKRDGFRRRAKMTVHRLILLGFKIAMPLFVYFEILNVLKNQFHFREDQLEVVTQFLDKNPHILHLRNFLPEKSFLLKQMNKYNLKTSDLVIFSHFLEIKTKKFYSYDKKMIRAFLSYRHEKES